MKLRIRLSSCDTCHRVLTLIDNKTVRYKHGCKYSTLTDVCDFK